MKLNPSRKLVAILLLIPFVWLSACATTKNVTPKSIILLISDGTGISTLTALKYTSDDFEFSRMPFVGLFTTHSADNLVTDSAAGATAFATGYKTYDHLLSILPDSTTKPETIVEIAEELGKSTGLVATSQLTHATPAAFASHVPSRYMEMEIARQEVSKNMEAMFGGGQDFFLRNDSAGNLVNQMQQNGYTYVDTRKQLEDLDAKNTKKAIGLFAPKGMKSVKEGRLPLSLMTQKAVQILQQNPKGFFLMVEASQVDWEAHANDADGIIAEVKDMNGALKWMLDFQEEHPDVLVVWVADHETGGLAINSGSLNDHTVRTEFTTKGHTGQMIPAFAIGPGAENFQGVYDNTDIGKRLISLIRNSQ